MGPRVVMAEDMSDALPETLMEWYRSEGVCVRSLSELEPKSRYVRVPRRHASEAAAIAS